MKLLGVLVGILGAILLIWHLVKAATNTETMSGITTHHLLSLAGGILIIVGTSIYILGRRRGRRSR